MSNQEIFEKLQELISEQFGLENEEIAIESSFVDDIGADSVDLVELVMTMEEEFSIDEIAEDDLQNLKTVGDCVKYLANVLG